jgi:hypothetical protein
MSRSLKVSHNYSDKVKLTITHKDYPYQRALANDIGVTSLQKFSYH